MKGARITVFGGSQLLPDDSAYQDAVRLGKRLGGAGCQVLTGGYIGSMEAVSRGAAEAGGHVIGVTCVEIEAWRPVAPNRWIAEERRFPTLRERLFALIEGCDAALALPGGIGTLAEIAVMWSHIQTAAINPRPLILIGAGWRTAMEAFYLAQRDYIAERDLQWLAFSPDVDSAFEELTSRLRRLAS